MPKLEITGNQNPIVGTTEFYSVIQGKNSILPQNETVQNQNDNLFDNEIKWFIYVLDRGVWRLAKGNEKIGATVDFTFTQIGLKWKEMKMIVHAYGQKAMIDIKPQKASQAKILRVDLLDNNLKTPTKPFAYGNWIIARVSCVDMERFPLTVTLWEDDGDKTKQNTGNVKIEVKKGNVLNGIADVAFYLDPSHAWLANAKLAKGDKDEGKFHEYYVTAEIFEKVSKRVPSKNANVPNPDYKTEPKQPTPAEQKGSSKKDKKGIAKSENKVHDYHETKVVVEPIVRPDLGMEIINSMMTVDIGDDKWWEKKKEKKGECYCNKDLTSQVLKDLGVSSSKATDFLDAINTTFRDYEINTCLRKIHFLSQVIHESGGFRYTKELNVADTAYNGYKGRGLIQLTGKDNYEEYEKYEKQDFTSSLENKIKLEKLPYSARSSGWFWKEKANLNDDADTNDHIYITRIINGGYNGYNDRLKNVKKGFEILYDNCKNDSDKNTDFVFNKSKSYNDKRGAFAWALWHDPGLNKDGCTKDKEKAIEGYSRFIELVDDNYAETNWYNILKISTLSNLKYIIKRKEYIKVLVVAKQRLIDLKTK